MCILAIASALGNVAIHTYNLYNSQYFQEYQPATFQNQSFNLTFELWVGVIAADAGIDLLALLATMSGLAAFGIGCCCAEYSEVRFFCFDFHLQFCFFVPLKLSFILFPSFLQVFNNYSVPSVLYILCIFSLCLWQCGICFTLIVHWYQLTEKWFDWFVCWFIYL